jgi:N-methylhydantoinase B
MGHQKIRVSNIWYGDYRAQVGACRTGERRLKELARQYGLETVKAFIEAWMDYGERRAIAAIWQLPRHLQLRSASRSGARSLRPGPACYGLGGTEPDGDRCQRRARHH